MQELLNQLIASFLFGSILGEVLAKFAFKLWNAHPLGQFLYFLVFALSASIIGFILNLNRNFGDDGGWWRRGGDRTRPGPPPNPVSRIDKTKIVEDVLKKNKLKDKVPASV